MQACNVVIGHWLNFLQVDAFFLKRLIHGHSSRSARARTQSRQRWSLGTLLAVHESTAQTGVSEFVDSKTVSLPSQYPTTVAQAQQWPAAATHLCKRWAKDGL